MDHTRASEAVMSPQPFPPAPLPTACVVERRHPLQDRAAPAFDVDLAPLAVAARALAAGLLGLWPLTVAITLAIALLACVGA
jgi:hypothetical protein